MLKSIKTQILILLNKRLTIAVFVGMILLILYRFIGHVYEFEGVSAATLISPTRLLLLSADEHEVGTISFYFLQILPIIFVLPVGFSYYDDVKSRENIYFVSKLGKINYFIGKIAAVFIVNFLVFLLPLLLEIALNCIAFPISANGNYSGQGMYEDVYIQMTEEILYTGTFIKSHYLYAILCCVIFGVIAGVMGVFTIAVSMNVRKLKVLLLLPTYILLLFVGTLNNIFTNIEFATSYFNYFSMYDSQVKNGTLFGILIVATFVLSVTYILVNAKKDVLE